MTAGSQTRHLDFPSHNSHPSAAVSGHSLLLRVLWIASCVVLSVLLLVLFGKEPKWQVYSMAGLVVLGIIAISPRKVLIMTFITTLSINVHYWVTQPLEMNFIGNTSPTAITIPLPILPALLLLCHQLCVSTQGQSPFRWGRPITLPAWLFFSVSLISVFFSQVRLYGKFSLVELLHFYLVFLTTLNIMRSKDDLDLALKMLLIVLGLQCCVFFLQTAFEVSFSATGQIMRTGIAGDTGMRANGTVGTVPSAFATFIEPLTFIALALFQTGERAALRFWGGVLALMGLAAIALTLNRSSWVGIVIGFFVFELLCCYTEPRKRHFMKFLLGLVVLSCIFLVLFPLLSPRIADKANSLETRLDLIGPAIQLIKAHPLLGVGPGAYPFVVRQYIGNFTGWLYYVHNDYLLIWAERGALGLIAWLWWFFAGMRQANRARRTLPQPYRALAIGCLTGFVVLLWELCLNSYEPFSSTALIWFLFGMLLAANDMSAQSRSTSRPQHAYAALP